MTSIEKNINKNSTAHSSAKKISKNGKSRWKRQIKVRAKKIKRQLQIENKFHSAMAEMRTTTDRYRASYLHWILNHMFSTFDYETGLQAINDKKAYETWLADNAQSR